MDERTMQAIVDTGALGKKIEAHLLQALALVDELSGYMASETAKTDHALETGNREEFNVANKMWRTLETLKRAVERGGQ